MIVWKTDLQILRTLCDERQCPANERSGIAGYLCPHTFIEPEHQVVFESIRALFPRGAITAARLIAHLTNRGFPDVDMEKYLPDLACGSGGAGFSLWGWC